MKQISKLLTILHTFFKQETGLATFWRNYQQERRERQTEARYQALVKATAQVVWTTNAEGYVVDALPSWQSLTGQSQEAIQGWGWLDAIHPDDRVETAQQWAQAVATKGIYEIEHRVRVINGSYRFFLARGVPVLDSEGEIIEWVGTHTDITDRKQAQELLHQSQTRFQRLVANMPGMVYSYMPCADGPDRFTFINSACRQLLELEPQTLIQNANTFLELIHPEDLLSFQESINIAAQNFLPWQWEGRMITPSGQIKWIQGTSRPEQTAEGEVWDGLLIDITERKQIEQALHQFAINLENKVAERTAQLQQTLEFEATLKRIFDKVRDSLDEGQIMQTAVQELTQVLGIDCCNAALYDLEEETSTIYWEYATLNPEAQARQIRMAAFTELYQQLKQGQYCQFCSLTLNPNRGRVAMLACPILDNQRALGDLWLIAQPHHAFNELELQLVQQVASQCAIAIRQARLYQAVTAQVQQLEKLNSIKDDFLSTVSHELRTPVANMKMAIHLLSMKITTEARERYLKILQTECAREVELINNLLDLQQLEVKSHASAFETVNLQDWLPNLVEPFQTLAQSCKLCLRLELPLVLSSLKSDRTSLERLLAELLNNACKYTPPGGEIVLNVRQNSCLANPKVQATIFTIANSVEIPATELPRIFEKFYRIPNSNSQRQGGTGLGLALVQKLVKHLHGTIEVDSSQGWTTFTVELLNPVNVEWN